MSGDATNGLTLSLGSFAAPSNVAYGVFAVNKNALAVTPGSGFAEIAQQASEQAPELFEALATRERSGGLKSAPRAQRLRPRVFP